MPALITSLLAVVIRRRLNFDMVRKSTIAWRIAVLGLLGVTVPFSIHHYEKSRQVDTETMLNVSVSIKTISHVKVDSVGD